MNSNTNDIKSLAYEGASVYGRYNGVMSGICGTIVICIIYGISFYFYQQSKKYNSNIINSKVISADCTLNKTQKGQITYYCNLEVSYTINNINYSNKIVTNQNKKYVVNDILKIKYNTLNPNDIIVGDLLSNSSSISLMLLFCGLCSCIILYGYIYLLFTSKKFAAASGAVSIASGVMGRNNSMGMDMGNINVNY